MRLLAAVSVLAACAIPTRSPALLLLYLATASSILFGTWPKGPVTVIWDGDCGFCAKSKEWVGLFDLGKQLVWRTYQSGAGTAFGISEEQARQRLYLAYGGLTWSGFGAFRKIVLWNPVWHLLLWGVLVLPGLNPVLRDATAVAVLLAFSPLFSPIGNAAYALVARNRHRLAANSTCGLK